MVYKWERPSTLEHYEEDKIRELLVGRTVRVVDESTLELDNGIRLTVHGNDGCGGCSSGWYELKELNGMDSAIMNVEFVEEENSYGEGYWDNQIYRVFVYAEGISAKLIEVAGDDGNGYYGSGYWIDVVEAVG